MSAMERLRSLRDARAASPSPAALPASASAFTTPAAAGIGDFAPRASPDAPLTLGGESSLRSSFDVVSRPSGGGADSTTATRAAGVVDSDNKQPAEADVAVASGSERGKQHAEAFSTTADARPGTSARWGVGKVEQRRSDMSVATAPGALLQTVPRNNTTSQVSLADTGTEAMAHRFGFQEEAAVLARHFDADGTSILQDVRMKQAQTTDDVSISTLGTLNYGFQQESSVRNIDAISQDASILTSHAKRKLADEPEKLLMDDLSIDRLKLEYDNEKKLPLFVFDGDASSYCMGKVGANQFCVRPPEDCTFGTHKKTKVRDIRSGVYIANPQQSAVFKDVFLSNATAYGSEAFRGIMQQSMPMGVWNKIFTSMEQSSDAGGADTTHAVNSFVEASKSGGMPTPSLKRTKLAFTEESSPTADQTSASAILGNFKLVEQVLDEHRNSIFGIQGIIGKQSGHHTSSYTSLWSAIRCITEDCLQLQSNFTTLGKDWQKQFGDSFLLAQSASSKAEACESSMQNFLLTGGGGKVSSLEARLGKCEADVGNATQDTNDLAGQLLDILSGKMALPPQPVPPGAMTQDSFNTAMNELRGKIARLQQTIQGGGVTCGNRTFDSFDSVHAFVRKSFPNELCYECFFDPISLLCQTTDNVVYADEVQQTEIHAERTKRTPAQSAMLHSFLTQVPPVFAGRKEATGTADAKAFGAMKTHDEWNPGDGTSGLYNKIFSDMDTVVKSLYGMMETTFRNHFEALSFCQDLLAKTLTFLEALCTEISSFYRYLLTTTYGVGVTYSAKAEAACWKVTLKSLKTWLEEMWKVRAPAKHAYSSLRDNHEINATYLYGVIQAHGVMVDFKNHGFRRHPKVYPEMVQHIFNTYVTNDDVASSSSTCSRLTQRCQQLETTLDTLKRAQDSQATTIADLKRQIASLRGHGGGKGGKKEDNAGS